MKTRQQDIECLTAMLDVEELPIGVLRLYDRCRTLVDRGGMRGDMTLALLIAAGSLSEPALQNQHLKERKQQALYDAIYSAWNSVPVGTKVVVDYRGRRYGTFQGTTDKGGKLKVTIDVLGMRTLNASRVVRDDDG